MPLSDESSSLRDALKSLLVELLAEMLTGKKPDQSQGEPTAAPGPHPGLWLSPLESAIWHALGADTLIGKQIAAKVSQPYDSCFKAILRNLIARDIVERAGSDGYRRKVQGATDEE